MEFDDLDYSFQSMFTQGIEDQDISRIQRRLREGHLELLEQVWAVALDRVSHQGDSFCIGPDERGTALEILVGARLRRSESMITRIMEEFSDTNEQELHVITVACAGTNNLRYNAEVKRIINKIEVKASPRTLDAIKAWRNWGYMQEAHISPASSWNLIDCIRRLWA